MSFHELGLNPDLLRALDDCEFSTPTEIQKQAIPLALAGRDIMASAQTGSGKTAAFVLPILQRLREHTPESHQDNRDHQDSRDHRGQRSGGRGPRGRNGRGQGPRGPRALILTPTRELATQITDVIASLSRYTRPRFGSVVGGVSYRPQERLLGSPVDILVATPGRLIDHMQQGNVNFTRLEVLVLDEADRMLDMGFIQAVEQIMKDTPKTRQTLLFSATLDGDIRRVVNKHLNDPERIQLAHAKQRHEGIVQWKHQADGLRHKKAVLSHLLSNPELTQAVVFTATKRRAKALAEEMSDYGHTCAPLHGDMTQAARRRAVDRLRDGKVRVLVATDVAARGLDVPGISHVINFELPMTPEDYIHRIGRTGRAGATGTAITLVGFQDGKKLAGIERLTGRAIAHKALPQDLPRLPDPAPRKHGKPATHGERKQGNGGGKSFSHGGERSPFSHGERKQGAGGNSPWRRKRSGGQRSSHA